jgi:D-alanine-D-alanine ligase
MTDTISFFDLRLPCIVKPRGEDASHGLSEENVVFDRASLREQVERVSSLYGGIALVEEFIDGREFNATVLGNREPFVLPPSEIVYSLPPGRPRLLTYASKWDPEDVYYTGTKPVCPAPLSSEQMQALADTASRSFRALECRGYARVDMRLDTDRVFNVLEVNPNPDISPGAGASIQAKAAGMDYPQFIERIVALAIEARDQAP